MRNFRTYELAVQFYKMSRSIVLPWHLSDQLSRAASSIALNLAEGYGKPFGKDRIRFYSIAFGSLRESQAILTLAGLQRSAAWDLLDKTGASLYRLLNPKLAG